MELEHVHISGFKAIDEIEFEPGQITLVTGPNNAGKTSLLEAIRLAGDPRSITEFEDQAPKPIKADHDAAECRVRVRDDSDEITEQRVEIRRPPTEQAVDEVIRLLSDEEFGFARYVGVPLGTEVSNITASRIEDNIRSILLNNRDQLAEQDVVSQLVAVQTEEETYHYAGKLTLDRLVSSKIAERVESVVEKNLRTTGDTDSDTGSPRIQLMESHVLSPGFPAATNDPVFVSELA